MKRLFCDENTGKIVEANVLKNGDASRTGLIERTSEAVIAVFKHISMSANFLNYGYGGYEWTKKDTGGKIKLMLFDSDLYELKDRRNGGDV